MEWQLAAGLQGFYLCGGTGEGPVLQKETRMRIAEIAKDAVGDRAKLIAHVGAIDLKISGGAGKARRRNWPGRRFLRAAVLFPLRGKGNR